MEFEKTYLLPFSVETVYSAWTSSNTVIPPATRMDIDPIVGGHYRLFMEMPDIGMSNEGKFLEVVANALLKYTWEWNGDGEVTEITVIFEAHEFGGRENGTEIRILHSGFANKESAAMHDSGWDSYVDGLTKFILNC
ncbi:MAG: SRPBCC domain-containing protein [Rhizobiaceae bacterium]|nr:SRPBCC domain-containing protein [Rhizobiaceae bacterium]